MSETATGWSMTRYSRRKFLRTSRDSILALTEVLCFFRMPEKCGVSWMFCRTPVADDLCEERSIPLMVFIQEMFC